MIGNNLNYPSLSVPLMFLVVPLPYLATTMFPCSRIFQTTPELLPFEYHVFNRGDADCTF